MHITIKVSATAITRDVVRHVMTCYKHSVYSDKNPLKYPEDPDRYQLWLIDEFESPYAPDEEMGARPAGQAIGHFNTMAFIENKNFKVN